MNQKENKSQEEPIADVELGAIKDVYVCEHCAAVQITVPGTEPEPFEQVLCVKPPHAFVFNLGASEMTRLMQKAVDLRAALADQLMEIQNQTSDDPVKQSLVTHHSTFATILGLALTGQIEGKPKLIAVAQELVEDFAGFVEYYLAAKREAAQLLQSMGSMAPQPLQNDDDDNDILNEDLLVN